MHSAKEANVSHELGFIAALSKMLKYRREFYVPYYLQKFVLLSILLNIMKHFN